MPKIMISLDKMIANTNSFSARRMVEYGKSDPLFILLPFKDNGVLNLSEKVKVFLCGGNKFFQFFKAVKIGRNLIKKEKIEEITTQDPFFTALISLLIKWRNTLQLEIQLHGDFFGGNYYKKSGLFNLFKYWMARLITLKRADRIRVVGERIRQSLIKLSLNKEKIFVEPIKVALKSIKEDSLKINLHQKYPTYEKIFLFLGRFDRVKNLSWLIDVFSEVVKRKSNCLLLLVGNGIEEKRLKEKVSRRKLGENVKFENWTNDTISYLKTTDCLLFPSLSEGYGLVVMEAVASKCPIIMNDVGVANYEVKETKNIKIIPINKKDQWIKSILQI